MQEQLPTTARMQEVGRKPLLRFLHSPHPCGLAMQERLPTTARMQELEQRREQLPSAYLYIQLEGIE
jgi:hypothetical protein